MTKYDLPNNEYQELLDNGYKDEELTKEFLDTFYYYDSIDNL